MALSPGLATFIELIDSLRCPASDHPDSALVASISQRSDRSVTEGNLGCPICGREYPITDGVAHFRAAVAVTSAAASSGSDHSAAPVGTGLRIGAFLNVREGITVVLTGEWSFAAEQLAQLLPLRVFAVTAGAGIDDSEAVGLITSDETLPFADASVSGVALGRGATSALVRSAERVLVSGGRLVAPLGLALPGSMQELARDDSYVVAEKRLPLVGITRR